MTDNEREAIVTAWIETLNEDEAALALRITLIHGVLGFSRLDSFEAAMRAVESMRFATSSVSTVTH